MDTGPPRREDEAEQIESSHKDARCLLEPDPRGTVKRRKDQDSRGYHKNGEFALMAHTIENDGPEILSASYLCRHPRKRPKRKTGGGSGDPNGF